MLVLDAEAARRPGLVRDAVRAGVDWVQLRDRELEARDLLALAEDLAETAPGAQRIVNRRCDVAMACGSGVHLGFDGLDPSDARSLLGSDALIGVSTHAPEEIDAACGASYAHLAPIQAPLSKPREREPLGLSALGPAAARGLPVIAQGGIDVRSARAAIEAGASGVAVTGAILLAADPARAAASLRRALDGASLA